MKVSLNNYGYEICIIIDENKNQITEDLLVNIIKEMNNSLNNIAKNEYDKHSLKPTPAVPVTTSLKRQVQSAPERPLVRDRLPNTSVIDPATLDVKKAVTEKALVRCPHCGQAHCLAINSGAKIYFMERDFNKNDFGIIAKFDSLTSKGFLGMCCKPETDKLLYFNDLQDAALITQEDFAAIDSTQVFCPVCCQSDSFFAWKNAYINPLTYFETEHLCDVCGGEKIEKIINKKNVHICESCGYQTEKTKED